MKKRSLLTLLILLLIAIPISANATIWYVAGDIASSGDGISWATAKKTIQEGIDVANTNDEVWVKMGTYSLLTRISVNKAISIYGGFNGTENDINQRNWHGNITIVDGMRSTSCFLISANATIDGFLIHKGERFLYYCGGHL